MPKIKKYESTHSPRQATQSERNELIAYNIHHNGSGDLEQDREDWSWWVQSAFIAIFDHYVTLCPGYAGKVMVVVWDGGPGLHDVYVWRQGQIERVRHDRACENCNY